MSLGQTNVSPRASGAGGPGGPNGPGGPGGPNGPRESGRRRQPGQTGPADATGGSSFEDHLESARTRTEPIELSAHAKRRIAQRGISLKPAQREALAEAVTRLDEKGAQEAAILRDDAAFVVSVPNRTVVTAVGEADMKDRAFTQIDSAMMI